MDEQYDLTWNLCIEHLSLIIINNYHEKYVEIDEKCARSV